MANFVLSSAAILKAEEYIASFLAAENPDADFSRGSVLRDLAVRSIAISYAFISSQGDKVRTLSRVKEIATIEDGEEREEAILNFVSNFYLTPREGRYAQGLADIHFSAPISGVVPASSLFIFNGSKTYVLNNNGAPLLYDSNDLTTVVAGIGGASTLLYSLRIPIISTVVGTSTHITPQVASDFTRFESSIVKVEAIEPITNGTDTEDADAFLLRIPDAITVRNLLTDRSISTVLNDAYPQISSLTVIGAEDPEMFRDVSPMSTDLVPIHTGGAVDIYVDTGVITVVKDLIIGEDSNGVDTLLTVFRDILYRDQDVNWQGIVEPGDTLRVYNTEGAEPGLYTIHTVNGLSLRVQDILPFKAVKPVALHGGLRYEECTYNATSKILSIPASTTRFTTSDISNFVFMWSAGVPAYKEIVAVSNIDSYGFGTDLLLKDVENDLVTFPLTGIAVSAYYKRVEYSIGDNGPSYTNKISRRPYGQITQAYSAEEGVFLSGHPVYKIHSVSLIDPTNTAASPSIGGVAFPTRVNRVPQMAADKSLLYEYQVVSLAPNYQQSSKGTTLIRVGPEDTRSGIRASLTVVNAAERTATVTVLTPVFSVNDIGLEVLITKAFNPGNPGLYTIDSVVDAYNVNVTKNSRHFDPDALATENNLSWSIVANSRVSGGLLRVTYDTLGNFNTVAAYVQDSTDRVIASNPLVKAYHPIYISLSLSYTLKSGATSINDDDLKSGIVGYINAFPPSDILNTNDVTSYVRAEYAEIGNILNPLTINYTLYSPTGETVLFTTTDAVSMDVSHLATASDSARYDEAVKYGVSDRTVRYLANRNDITVVKI